MSDLSTSSAPPASVKPQPPYDPALERLRLVRGMAVDLAVVAAVVALAITKTVSGDAAIVVVAALAGAGAVHKGSAALGSRVAQGGAAIAIASSLIGRGGGDA